MRWKELAGLAACAVSAAAHGAWGLKYEVSPNGISWGPAIVVAPGGTVYFRMGAYFDLGTQVTTAGGNGTAVVLGRVAGQQIITNTIVGQDFASELTRFVPSQGISFLNVSNTASGILIGSTAATSYGYNNQLNIDSYLEVPEPSTLVFKGKLAIGADPTPRTFTFRNNIFGTANEPGMRFYNDVPGSPLLLGTPIDSPNHTDFNATIQVSTASCSPPVIHSVSGTTSVSPSQIATFTVNASGGAFYEWLKNGHVINPAGQTGVGTATMTIPYPRPFDAASYQVRVYSLCGATTVSSAINLSIVCAADLNRDGFVDDADFVLFAQTYDKLGCGGDLHLCEADFDLDGIVDDADFVVFAGQYEQLICP
ncbi:MAG: hypothetical protein JNM86_06885 [Phycisphaerae bacterium]|nr:hypothetical protein [Phycisphaerae bacterium]